MKHICTLCGYIYDPNVGDIENGISEGTDFEDISSEWTCPLCGASKDDFEVTEDDEISDTEF